MIVSIFYLRKIYQYIVSMFQVNLRSTENWGNAGNGLITVTNTSTAPIRDWTFKLDVKGIVVTDAWEVTAVTNKSILTVSGKEWNNVINPGQTITSGFAYTGDDKKLRVTTKDTKVSIVSTPVPIPVPTPTPVPTPSLTPSQSSKRIVGYLAQWDMYDRAYAVADSPGDKLTHIMYAFCLPNPSLVDFEILKKNYPFPPKPYYPPPQLPEGALAIHDEYAFQTQVPQLQALKRKYPHLKLGLSVGGWTLSWTMSKVMADPKLRSTFVKTCVEYLLKYQFDILDLDWEYPGKQGAGYNIVDTVNDSKNVATFFKELRAEMDAKSPSKRLGISVASGANKMVIDQYKESAPYIDEFNLMTYDFYGSWGDGGHLAGLYPNPAQSDSIAGFNVHDAVKTALAHFPPAKISIGCPFYARGWAQLKAEPNTPTIFGKSVAGPGVTLSEKKGGEPGLSCWKDLVPAIKNKQYTEYWDDVSKVPYCVKETTKEVWSYDNPRSVSEKMKYIVDNDLGGVIIWQLSDDVRDIASPDSLLNAVHKTLTTYKKN